ncbi:MAG: HD domain-containing protein [Bacilli bacterium]|nr:HD domain-containing protein [Bacilli bacterium]
MRITIVIKIRWYREKYFALIFITIFFKKDVVSIYKEFDEYVNSFNFLDKGINRKISHSKRVAILNAKLAMDLKWSFDDVKLAKQIGLLHDIGRFDEWKKFKKYDQNKFDHGEHGVNILKNNNYLNKFNLLKKEDKDILYEAIYYHNKYQLPKKVNDHAKLIRDADKIDILYLHTIDDGLNSYNNNFSNTISAKIHKEFMEGKSILVEDVNTYAEFMVLTLAFIYDINYEDSLKIIKENNFINKIYNKLDNKEIYEAYFNKINNYMEKRLKNVR